MLHRLQERFYAHNEDITDRDAVAQTCGEFGLAREEARAALEDPALVDGVRREFRDVAGLGVTGYPTLLALTKPKPKVVTIGCRPREDVVQDLELALAEASA
jgi:protein-disulfide isomerase-like protein with CxxC motif